MEAKCSFCDFFGEKQHCHNCKVINKTRTHAPQEIECSLEELVEYINNNQDITDKYGVGDYKTIELISGEKVKLVLLDTDKDQLADGTGYARATFGIMSTDGLFRMNVERTNAGGWRDSEMRNVRMERFYRLLPEVLRNAIKPVVKHTSAGGGSSEIISTTDKCFLFSEVEILGEVEYSKQGEGTQYAFFMDAINRSFQKGLWMRSPFSGYSGNFCRVGRTGDAVSNGANDSSGVAFGFCV